MSDHTTEPAALEFLNEGLNASIRVTAGPDGEPRFAGTDLARSLGYRDASDALHVVDDDDKGTEFFRTSSGLQKLLCVNESGLYQLMMRSQLPAATAFRKWVTGEVLPQIRKTGSYSRQLTTAEQLVVQAQRLVAYEKQQAELDRQQRELERNQLETRLKVLEQAARIDNQQQAIERHDAQLDSLNHKDGCLTILAWWKQRDVTELLTNSLAAQLGKRVTAVYRQRFGKEPYQTPDGKFGFVNQYPETLLDELLGAFVS